MTITDPKIVDLNKKILVGRQLTMSLRDNETAKLWQSFMPHKKDIKHTVSADLYSLQVYAKGFAMKDFTPATKFQKWAAIEVSKIEKLPANMEILELPAGKYAVFTHNGPVSKFHETASHIYGTWLPSSPYKLDNRPHFEVMGEKYLGVNHPDSEEEVWIPICK